MADASASQTARQWLERQLAELGTLYNAGVRSPVFREWRQATLTCIQRIWPAEPSKSERFRRIPFSAPMGRPAEREVREYFERGCGEASSLLKDLIADIASGGLPAGAAPSLPSVPGADADEGGFPNVELPGPGAGSTGATGAPPKPRLKDLLGFSDVPAHVDEPAPSRPPPAAGGAPPLPAPAPASGAHAPKQELPEGLVGGGPGRLPGLESHGFFAPPTPAGREASPPAAPGPPATGASSRIVVTGARPEPGTGPAPSAPGAPERAASAGPAGARGADPAAQAADTGHIERVKQELLRATAALGALPRRTTPERGEPARDPQSGVALAVAALATEVEALGVPEGHRARARAMLLDLSRRLDSPNLPWGTLREAVTFVMDFPPLGRRLMPLLLPYIDRAA